MSRRVIIRLVGLVIALFLLAAVPVGILVARVGNPDYILLYWIGCVCLVASLLGVAALDVLETIRMARKARIDMIRKAILPTDRDDS